MVVPPWSDTPSPAGPVSARPLPLRWLVDWPRYRFVAAPPIPSEAFHSANRLRAWQLAASNEKPSAGQWGILLGAFQRDAARAGTEIEVQLAAGIGVLARCQCSCGARHQADDRDTAVHPHALQIGKGYHFFEFGAGDECIR